MTDLLKKFRESTITSLPSDSAERLLNDLMNQLSKELSGKGVIPYVTTSEGYGENVMYISLTLMSDNVEKQYFYRLIEIEQTVGKLYPVKVRAFQNPPSDWKEVNGGGALENELINIMGDVRVKIVIEMIRQMGKTINEWIEAAKSEG